MLQELAIIHLPNSSTQDVLLGVSTRMNTLHGEGSVPNRKISVKALDPSRFSVTWMEHEFPKFDGNIKALENYAKTATNMRQIIAFFSGNS